MLDIGSQIKKLREERHLTGKELALRIGLSQSQMSRLEQGQRRIDTEILAKIANALEVSPACFFGDAPVDQDPLTPRRERELSLARLHSEIGKRIRSERRQRHLTIEDLARKTGHTRAFVLAVEEGRRNGLEDDFLRKACRLLAIDPFTVAEAQERIIRDLKTRVHRLDRDIAASPPESIGGEPFAATPILVGDESVYPAEFDEKGHPIAAVEGFLTLPDLADRATFALRVKGAAMDPGFAPRFRDGDLVVFATDRSAQSGEYAFVRFHGNKTDFRRLFHDADSVIRLQALSPDIPPILLDLDELTSAWPLVNHVAQPE
ncbi:MAG: helix-turn-helix domain-containing protein [Planctomycetota bacterium]